MERPRRGLDRGRTGGLEAFDGLVVGSLEAGVELGDRAEVHRLLASGGGFNPVGRL
jgi:hypothetical protein